MLVSQDRTAIALGRMESITIPLVAGGDENDADSGADKDTDQDVDADDCCTAACATFEAGEIYFLPLSCLKLCSTLTYAIALEAAFRRTTNGHLELVYSHDHVLPEDFFAPMLMAFLPPWFLLTSVLLVVSTILQGAMLCTATDIHEGRTRSISTCVKMGFMNLHRFLCSRKLLLIAFLAPCFVVAGAMVWSQLITTIQPNHPSKTYYVHSLTMLVFFVAGIASVNTPMMAFTSSSPIPSIFNKFREDQGNHGDAEEHPESLSNQGHARTRTFLASPCLVFAGCAAEAILLCIMSLGGGIFDSWRTALLGVVAIIIAIACPPLNIIIVERMASDARHCKKDYDDSSNTQTSLYYLMPDEPDPVIAVHIA